MSERTPMILLSITLMIALGHTGASSDFQDTGSNESIGFEDRLNITRVHYFEDLNCSREILGDYLNNRTGDKEAMSATISLMLLSSNEISHLRSTEVPEEYRNASNYTMNSLIHMSSYLWGLSKFYETKKSPYLNMSYDSLNMSLQYHLKSVEESDRVRNTRPVMP